MPIDITKSLSIFNTITFLSLAVQELAELQNSRNYKRKNSVLVYSALLLGIAGFHYAILDVNKPNIKEELYIRYSDWIMTTPLLLVVLGNFYNISMKKISLWILLDLMMVINGLLYEINNNITFWYIGSLSYIFLLVILYKQLPEHDLFYKYFVVGWSGYGIVSLLPLEKRFMLFNILDFYNKFVFAYDINNRLK